MNQDQAHMFRAARDAYVKHLSRRTRPALFGTYRNELAAAGRESLYMGKMSRDELIRALVELRYPAAKFNETTHVLYHVDGGWNSACELCHDDDGLHAGHLCECSRHADTDCTYPGCQHRSAAFHFSSTYTGPGRRPELHPHGHLGHVYTGPLGRPVDDGSRIRFIGGQS